MKLKVLFQHKIFYLDLKIYSLKNLNLTAEILMHRIYTSVIIWLYFYPFGESVTHKEANFCR